MTYKELSIALDAILSDHSPQDLNEDLYLDLMKNLNKAVKNLIKDYHEIQCN